MDNIAASPIQPTSPEPVAPSTPAPLVQENGQHQPFTIFESEHGIPYTAKFFGYNKPSLDALAQADIDDLIPKMSMIDNYVHRKITAEGYLDSTETYQQIIANIKEMLGIQDFEPANRQIEKLFLYMYEGRPLQKEFVVRRSSKAEEIDHQRNQRIKQLKELDPHKYRKLDNMFTKFLNI